MAYFIPLHTFIVILCGKESVKWVHVCLEVYAFKSGEGIREKMESVKGSAIIHHCCDKHQTL